MCIRDRARRLQPPRARSAASTSADEASGGTGCGAWARPAGWRAWSERAGRRPARPAASHRRLGTEPTRAGTEAAEGEAGTESDPAGTAPEALSPGTEAALQEAGTEREQAAVPYRTAATGACRTGGWDSGRSCQFREPDADLAS